VLRNTKQKEAVISVLKEMNNHPCAEDVAAKVRERYPSIGRSSVFRILSQMADNGVVLRVRVPDGADRFDHRTHRHCHVKCSRCGRVVDAADCVRISDVPFFDPVSGFRITGYSVLLEGLCEDCISEAEFDTESE
jgi:Fe2+ or Zn2+ uptake regulation protein